ncbi:MAG: cellulase family glycosylhydrolase [Oscillospiraceae bacterium]|nr:cellulase family glycosylhydrolase [Oscillospiraceae bacterium]
MSKKVIRAGALILTAVLLTAGCTRSEYSRDPGGNGYYSSTDGTDSGNLSDENSSSDPTQSSLTLELKKSASWNEGSNYCGTVEVVVKNSGSETSGWSASFIVPSGFSITTGWGASFSVNGTTVTVASDSNSVIPQNGSITAGFNFSSPSDFSPSGGTASGNQNNSGSSGSSGGHNNDQIPNENVSGTVAELLERVPEAKQGDDWLHTDGRRILDKDGKEVWITGVNWFGYNTGTNTFDGLWNSQLAPTVKSIADHGFNLIRVPISAQLINQWSAGEYPRANYNNAYNTELNDMNSLQIFDYFLKLAEQNGMKVMPDIHSAETDASGHNVNLWYTSNVSVEDYYRALEWIAERYKDNDTIIAIDIKNEPHGKPFETNKAIWNNSTDINNWKYTAETAAKRILAKNPNLLIMVEGTEIFPINSSNMDYHSTDEKDYYFNWWGGNLRGVKNYPVNLGQYQNKLVYSPHDYGPTVYEQPWFKNSYDYDSLMKDCWHDNWFYIYEDNTAPLLIGEWGGFMRDPNLKWMTCMRQLIKTYHLNHTFWCFNANSGDTGGLVLDDFKTWDTEKYGFVKEVLWQEGGKFVGLDHAIPLGENGITLTSAKGL